MKAPSLIIQKIWPMLKFLQTDRQTVQKLYAPDLSIRGHKKRDIVRNISPVHLKMNRVRFYTVPIYIYKTTIRVKNSLKGYQ